jgi:hypothetical protein
VGGDADAEHELRLARLGQQRPDQRPGTGTSMTLLSTDPVRPRVVAVNQTTLSASPARSQSRGVSSSVARMR